jgi:hypothetical protein
MIRSLPLQLQGFRSEDWFPESAIADEGALISRGILWARLFRSRLIRKNCPPRRELRAAEGLSFRQVHLRRACHWAHQPNFFYSQQIALSWGVKKLGSEKSPPPLEERRAAFPGLNGEGDPFAPPRPQSHEGEPTLQTQIQPLKPHPNGVMFYHFSKGRTNHQL